MICVFYFHGMYNKDIQKYYSKIIKKKLPLIYKSLAILAMLAETSTE